MNISLKHLGSTGGLLTMLCFHEHFNVLYSFEYFSIYCLVWMTTLQIWLIVLVAVADEKQVSTLNVWEKMDALMRRQTTPVRWINKSLFFWLQRMSLISRQRLKKKDGKRDQSMEQNLRGKAVLWGVLAIFLSINRLKKTSLVRKKK